MDVCWWHCPACVDESGSGVRCASRTARGLPHAPGITAPGKTLHARARQQGLVAESAMLTAPTAPGLCFRPEARPSSSVGQSCGLLIRRSWVRAPRGAPTARRTQSLWCQAHEGTVEAPERFTPPPDCSRLPVSGSRLPTRGPACSRARSGPGTYDRGRPTARGKRTDADAPRPAAVIRRGTTAAPTTSPTMYVNAGARQPRSASPHPRLTACG